MTTNLKTTTSPPLKTKSVLFFWASWHDESAPNGSTSALFETLASTTTEQTKDNNKNNVNFYRVEAEENPELSAKYNVTMVPTFIFIDANDVVLKKIEGMDDIENIAEVTNTLQTLVQSKAASSATETVTTSASTSAAKSPIETEETEEQKLNRKLKSLISSSQIMLFIKGTPTQPKCGFSRQAVELLSSSKLAFGSYNILTNDEVRQGLKVYSDWPTFPQLYVRGELIGGLDIMKELNGDDGGDLADALDVEPMDDDNGMTNMKISAESNDKHTTLDERLKALTNRSKIVLFMKGLPSQPRCGFSRQICELMVQEKIDFDAFDILSDEDVRQGLKLFSDWPTFPQLYVDGDLVGGLDIVKELVESGEFKEMIEG